MILSQYRDRLLSRIIDEEIKAYIQGKKTRPCATCGTRFYPINRYHFFCQGKCRKFWYKGQFRPRD